MRIGRLSSQRDYEAYLNDRDDPKRQAERRRALRGQGERDRQLQEERSGFTRDADGVWRPTSEYLAGRERLYAQL